MIWCPFVLYIINIIQLSKRNYKNCVCLQYETTDYTVPMDTSASDTSRFDISNSDTSLHYTSRRSNTDGLFMRPRDTALESRPVAAGSLAAVTRLLS